MAVMAVAALAGAAASAGAGALIAGTALAGTIIGSALVAGAGLVASGLVSGALASKPQPQSVSAARSQGILINTSSTVEAIPVIYGSRRVGGSRILCEATGTNNEFLHIVVALCEGEIEEITNVYFDNVISTDARFTGFFTIEKYLGTDTQAASAALVAAVTAWTSAHQGKGVAYVYAKLTWDQSVWHGLPTITADVKGRKIYNASTTLTAFSNNPAWCIRDYLTNTRYGRGIPSANIDDASFITAASHCDEMVDIPGPSTQKRYTCDGVIDIDNTLFDNLNELLTSCRGFLVKVGDKYKLVIDKLETPSIFEFNEDNITGSWTISMPGRREKFNRVTASMFNGGEEWQPDLAISDSSAFRTQDNGLLLEGEIALPFTSDMYRAQQMAGLHMKNSRFGIVCSFTAFQEGLLCMAGDVVPITHSMPGWVSKPFRIIEIGIENDDLVRVLAREYDDTAYDLDTLTTITGAATVNLPDPFVVGTPTGLTLTSLDQDVVTRETTLKRLLATWTAPADTFIGDTEFWADVNDSGTFLHIGTNRANVPFFYVTPVQEGQKWSVKIRHRNSLGVYSAFCAVVDHYIDSPSGLFWNQNDDVDFWDIDEDIDFWSDHDDEEF